MAIGDVVGGIKSSTGGILMYVPAAGTEAIITCVGGWQNTGYFWGLYNGSVISDMVNSGAMGDSQNVKIPVTNSLYLYISASSTKNGGYAGVITKQ